MTLKQWFNRALRYLDIPHVTLFLTAGLVVVYFLSIQHPDAAQRLSLVFSQVAQGQLWRLVTGPLYTGRTVLVFLLMEAWFLYWVGNILESQWGCARYNLYLLIGYLATVVVSVIFPNEAVTFVYLELSLFLAFAELYPHVQILIFFIFPVEARWLAVGNWIIYASILIFGTWPTRCLALASLVNYFIVFTPNILARIRARHHNIVAEGKRVAAAQQAFHVCRVCDITDKQDPHMEFRYCPLCKGSPGYCANHIRNHEHLT